ncbi:hypothetical protein B0A48_15140 [Cryoendolithus antarcticus]|uniref:CCHC-type domain-containing protein n=1 Tax=Cryoendolithus antarcticus TaxID=1507870 RepID=A0A1V8SK95_9PEZI|nr:hypothetical protein B0A48_15140 [Cryoendolithus antarcticus]
MATLATKAQSRYLNDGFSFYDEDGETSQSSTLVSPAPMPPRNDFAHPTLGAPGTAWDGYNVHEPVAGRSMDPAAVWGIAQDPLKLMILSLRKRTRELETAQVAQAQAFRQYCEMLVLQRERVESYLHTMQAQVARLDALQQPQLPSPRGSACNDDSEVPQHLQDIADTNEMACKGRTLPPATGFAYALAARIASQSVQQRSKCIPGVNGGVGCAYCHGKDHLINQCLKESRNKGLSLAERARRFANRECFGCGRMGHLSKQCPMRARV